MRVGFLLNPIAGMGGRVGLKGTDGNLAEARARGAEPRAPDRARRALERLFELAPETELVTVCEPMGASLARAVGFDPTVLDRPATVAPEVDSADDSTDVDRIVNDAPHVDSVAPDVNRAATANTTDADADVDIDADSIAPETTATDTTAAVAAFCERDVDLVWFVGGDGTAADVAAALEGHDVPMLGVPAGVKVYSSVFAVSPEDAAEIAVSFERTERREVMDIDEDDYRAGAVSPQLRAIASVPVAEALQSAKQRGGGSVDTLAAGVAGDVDPERTYVLGPGSTLEAIKRAIGFEGSPLGVDVWRDGRVLAADASEGEILATLGERNTIVVSPIGGPSRRSRGRVRPRYRSRQRRSGIARSRLRIRGRQRCIRRRSSDRSRCCTFASRRSGHSRRFPWI